MAVDAIREFGHETGWMRRAVAVLTQGDHFVFCPVTFCAEQLAVFGCAGSQLF